MCVCVRLHSENSEPTISISQTTPDEHPPTPPPCRWPALITLLTLAKFQLVGAASAMLCCSAPPACSGTPSLPSEYYPSISLVVNMMYIEHLHVLYIFDQTDLYRVEVRLELHGSNALLIVSPPSLSPSHPPTPPPKPMASSHHFIPPRQVSDHLASLV